MPGALTAIPSAMRVAGARQVRPRELGVHARIELGLDADDLDAGLQRLGRGGDAGDEAAAADRHDQRIDVGRVGEHLERDRALSRDDLEIVERMDEGQPALAPRSAAPRHRPRRRSRRGGSRSAPWPSVWLTLIVGVEAGITIVAGTPRRAA